MKANQVSVNNIINSLQESLKKARTKEKRVKVLCLLAHEMREIHNEKSVSLALEAVRICEDQLRKTKIDTLVRLYSHQKAFALTTLCYCESMYSFSYFCNIL